MLVDGNDDRGIDVGILARANYPLRQIRTHVFDTDADGVVFSRDCCEYHFGTPQWRRPCRPGQPFQVEGLQHPGRPAGCGPAASAGPAGRRHLPRPDRRGCDPGGGGRRSQRRPDQRGARALLSDTDLRDISTHPDFDFGTRKGTFGSGNEKDKIDYVLLSPELFDTRNGGAVFRKGVWRGSRTKNPWPIYDTLTDEVRAASDHAAIYADYRHLTSGEPSQDARTCRLTLVLGSLTERALRIDDAAAITEILAAMERAEPVDEAFSEQDIVEELSGAGCRPRRGSIGIFDGDRLVALRLAAGQPAGRQQWKATLSAACTRTTPRARDRSADALEVLQAVACRHPGRRRAGPPGRVPGLGATANRPRTAALLAAAGLETWRYFLPDAARSARPGHRADRHRPVSQIRPYRPGDDEAVRLALQRHRSPTTGVPRRWIRRAGVPSTPSRPRSARSISYVAVTRRPAGELRVDRRVRRRDRVARLPDGLSRPGRYRAQRPRPAASPAR